MNISCQTKLPGLRGRTIRLALGCILAPLLGSAAFAETIYSVPLDTDPGWTAEGLWAFGQPTGGGEYCGDPTAGKTGANVLRS